ncbi:cystatin B [Perilla frutescens var. hirtella]|nr:cystatin B [Perilla frutescens var. hirtella]
MKFKSNNNKNTLYFSLFLAVVAVICEVGICREPPDQTITMKLGGLRNTAQNSGKIESMGRFAVQQHNQNQNTLLEFARIVKAKEQVVSGKMYHLTLEAIDGGKNKIYEAKVWVKPWMNFKQLQEFKEVHDNPIMSSYLGIKHGVMQLGTDVMILVLTL